MPFAKVWVKILVRIKDLSGIYSQKPLDHAKNSVAETVSLSISETVKNKNDKEIPKERYISPEERQEIIDHLRLILRKNNWISKNREFLSKHTKSTTEI